MPGLRFTTVRISRFLDSNFLWAPTHKLRNVSNVVFQNISLASNAGLFLSVTHGHNVILSNASILFSSPFSSSYKSDSEEYYDGIVFISNTTGSIIIEHSNFNVQPYQSIVVHSSSFNLTCTLGNEIVMNHTLFNQSASVSMLFEDSSGCLNVSVKHCTFDMAQEKGLELVSTAPELRLGTELDSNTFQNGLGLSIGQSTVVHKCGVLYVNQRSRTSSKID